MDPDPNWAKILDPDKNSMYLDPQHCFILAILETSQGTKRPKRQNVPRDKTSQDTKSPKGKKIFTFQFPIFLKFDLSAFFGNGPHMLDITGTIKKRKRNYFGDVRPGHSFILAILD